MTALARRAVVPALAATALAGGCASGGDEAADTRNGAVQPSAREPSSPARERADTRRAGAAAVRVIRAWVSAERRSEPAEAASFFSLPAVVLNGPAPLLLRTREAVEVFNAQLPCGAVLLGARDVRGWTVARFRLIERPGADCDGVGNTASTAFGIRDGRIAAWIRLDESVPLPRALPGLSPRETLRAALRQAGRRPAPRPPAEPGPAA